jgi:hypothetical protein
MPQESSEAYFIAHGDLSQLRTATKFLFIDARLGTA